MNYLLGAWRFRLSISAFAVFFLVLALLGCGTHYGVSRLKLQESFSGAKAEIFQRMLDIFNQEFSGRIQIEHQSVSPETFRSEFEKAIKNEEPFHLLILQSFAVPEYQSRNELEILSNSKVEQSFKVDDFITHSTKYCSADNELIAVPIDFAVLGLYYNAKAVESARLNPDNPPTNMQQFLQWAKALTKDLDGDGKIDQYGLLIPNSKNDSTLIHIWFSLLAQNSGTFLDASGKKCLANSPQGVKALQFLVDLVNKERIAVLGEPNKDFLEGKAAMLFGAPDMIGIFSSDSNFDFKTAAFPALFDKKLVWGGSYTVAVVKQDDNAKKRAAFEFIKWLSDSSWMLAQSGQIPAKKSVLNSNKFKKNPLYIYQKTFIESQDNVVHPPALPKVFSDDASGPLYNAIIDAISKQKTPQAALDECAAAVDSMLR